MQIHANETLVFSTRWDEETVGEKANRTNELQVVITINDERHEALSSSRMSLAAFIRGPIKGHQAF